MNDQSLASKWTLQLMHVFFALQKKNNNNNIFFDVFFSSPPLKAEFTWSTIFVWAMALRWDLRFCTAHIVCIWCSFFVALHNAHKCHNFNCIKLCWSPKKSPPLCWCWYFDWVFYLQHEVWKKLEHWCYLNNHIFTLNSLAQAESRLSFGLYNVRARSPHRAPHRCSSNSYIKHTMFTVQLNDPHHSMM